jgi:cell division protein FtsL
VIAEDAAVQSEEEAGTALQRALVMVRVVGRRIVLGVLLLATVSSALEVIYNKHLSRRLFAELQTLQKERDDINVEYDRLLLEESTWAEHGRIEQIARSRLGMVIPATDSVVMIRE